MHVMIHRVVASGRLPTPLLHDLPPFIASGTDVRVTMPPGSALPPDTRLCYRHVPHAGAPIDHCATATVSHDGTACVPFTTADAFHGAMQVQYVRDGCVASEWAQSTTVHVDCTCACSMRSMNA